MSACWMGWGCYWWDISGNRRKMCSEIPWWRFCRGPCARQRCASPLWFLQLQHFRGGADAQSLSGYISIELLLDIDGSFEALQPPCINVSGVGSALSTELGLTHPKEAAPPAWQLFFPRFCILFLLSLLVVYLAPPIISWNMQIVLFACKQSDFT